MKRSQQRVAVARAPDEGADHVERRAEIRDRARDLFLRHGYRKTTIEDIGKACGLGKAALYHYFDGKEAIFAEVVRAGGEEVLARTRKAVKAARDPRDQFIAMVRTIVAATGEIVDELVDRRSAAELQDFLPLVAAAHRSFIAEAVELLSGILDAGARSGVFRKVSAPSVPLVIILGLRSIQFPSVDVGDPRLLRGAVDTLVDLFLGGLGR